MSEEDCVAICSGGLDSTVMLYWLLSQAKKPIVISFDYGQKHKKELECIKKTCEELGLRHHIIKLDLAPILQKSALIDPNKELPHEHYTDETQKITVVPNRNMVMLSIAIACAENEEIQEVYYSPHANDEAIYPDCREEFVLAMSTASYLATYTHVVVIAPFVKMYKKDLVALGHRLGVPFENTWSCYEGKEKACGLCATCQERIEAFKENGLVDPIPYEIDIDW